MRQVTENAVPSKMGAPRLSEIVTTSGAGTDNKRYKSSNMQYRTLNYDPYGSHFTVTVKLYSTLWLSTVPEMVRNVLQVYSPAWEVMRLLKVSLLVANADITGWSLSARDGEITSIGYHVSIWVQPLYCHSICWAEIFLSISSTDKSIASVSSSGHSFITDTNKLGWKVCSNIEYL